MSSDYRIPKKALDDLGVIFLEEDCEFTKEPATYAKFPGYQYHRDIMIDEENEIPVVHISCGGAFRNWLERDFLAKHNVQHEKF